MNILVKTTLSITAAVIVLMSCHGTKKSSSTQTASTPPPEPPPAAVTATVATVPGSPSTLVRNGIIPGEPELSAIKQKYPETTAQNLANGHAIYIGQCTDCHRKKNIFVYSETKWKDIIADMAPRSKLSPQETDDLYKYVLSMKATENAYAK